MKTLFQERVEQADRLEAAGDPLSFLLASNIRESLRQEIREMRAVDNAEIRALAAVLEMRLPRGYQLIPHR